MSMFSALSSYIWGAEEKSDGNNNSETADWLFVSDEAECNLNGEAKRKVDAADGNCMTESWLVTPPQIFQSNENTTTTGPMENLLIEHPSMSVYRAHERKCPKELGQTEKKLSSRAKKRPNQQMRMSSKHVNRYVVKQI